MTTKNIRSGQKYKNLNEGLKEINFNKHAVSSGFQQRKAKKIKGKELVIGFILMVMQKKNTFEQWATHVSYLSGETISKQGLFKRINQQFIDFLLCILFDAMKKQLSAKQFAVKEKVLRNYKRILIQDSTTIALPMWLNKYFPGSVSAGNSYSQLKIQVIYDLQNNRFVHFEITSNRQNDQSKTKDILQLAGKKDIVIRDMGYFASECFKLMNEKNISFISRLKYDTNVFDVSTEERIDVFKYLKKNKVIDKWVLMSGKHKAPVRIVGITLSAERAVMRRRIEKKHADQRANHSKHFYQMLSYDIYVTSQDLQDIAVLDVVRLYGMRWRIENIFRSWKSHFQLQQMIPQNRSLTRERALAMVYMMLIFVILFQTKIYHMVLLYMNKSKRNQISLIKLSKFIADNIWQILFQHWKYLMPQIVYFSQYEKRSDRLNFIQKHSLS